jgi:5-methylcytosine-specific restriction endonuclease McrA
METVKRKRLTKRQRHEIYKKTGGRCAYCGLPLRINEMCVDHIKPLCQGGADSPENMLPACRSCNSYKSSCDLEVFRRNVGKIPAVLSRDSRTYCVAVRFGLVVPRPRKVTFFFEEGAQAAAVDNPTII